MVIYLCCKNQKNPKKQKPGKNKEQYTLYTKNNEYFKNSKPRVQIYWFLYKRVYFSLRPATTMINDGRNILRIFGTLQIFLSTASETKRYY